MTYSLNIITPRPAPIKTNGIILWLRTNLFADIITGIATLILGSILFNIAWHIIDWGIIRASIIPNPEICRANHAGACWGAIIEKYRLIFFGRYPFEEQWRPLIASILMILMVIISCIRYFWTRWLILLWSIGLVLFFIILLGGYFGLSIVGTDRWGGFPLTLLLATTSIGMAVPIALLVALGRISKLPVIRACCTVYIELIRGVPLVSVLFMASFMLPLLMPQGLEIDTLLRVIIGITLFAAAYMAEVIRGGLQAIPKGQIEAAATLGLNYWQTQLKIVLPQALSMVVPSLMNNFIAIFIDTSLVTIVSLYELMGSHGLAFNSDVDWRPYKIEGYLFIASIYFVFCFAMTRYSRWIEYQANQGRMR